MKTYKSSDIFIDWTSSESIDNPYPNYQKLLSQPEAYSLQNEFGSAAPILLFSRYSDAIAVLSDTKMFSKDLIAIRGTEYAPFFLNMLHRDGDDHKRLRKLVASYITPTYLTILEHEARDYVAQLVGRLQKKRNFDLITDFAAMLPLWVVSKLLGTSIDDSNKLRDISRRIGAGFDSTTSSTEEIHSANRAMEDLIQFSRQTIRQKQETPAQDLISYLISIQSTNDGISDEELVAMVSFMVFASQETTVNLIGNCLITLARYPDQWQLLQDHPELIDSAIDETLRYESPLQRTTFRIARYSGIIGCTRVEKGQQVAVLIGAANRDPSRFEDPDTFNIHREKKVHLAFGFGPYTCLGTMLAKLEARIILQKLSADGCPPLCVDLENYKWVRNTFVRGLEFFPGSFK